MTNVQIGKNGLTENFIETLKNHFKNSQTVRISVLKSATRDREELKKMTSEILEKLGKNYTTRIIGFTLVVKKWRKNIR
jgi:RNA-binding protein YhbY